MEIKQLRALVAIAETGTVSRAAEALHIVQPAVSRQLRLLEEEFGMPLFTRERHGMQATDAGATLVAYARRALEELERARTELKPASDVSGSVAVGLLPHTAHLATQLVQAAAQRYPKLRLRILTGYTGHLRQWLESGEADAALVHDSRALPTLQLRPLIDEKLWLVGLPAAGYEAGRPVSASALAGLRIVLPGAQQGLRTRVEQYCASMRIALDIAAETNAIEVQKQLVLAGVGATILPGSAVTAELAQGSLSAAPFADRQMERRIALALPRTRKLPAAVHGVTGILVEHMRRLVNAGQWPTATWIAPA